MTRSDFNAPSTARPVAIPGDRASIAMPSRGSISHFHRARDGVNVNTDRVDSRSERKGVRSLDAIVAMCGITEGVTKINARRRGRDGEGRNKYNVAARVTTAGAAWTG